MRRLPWTLYRYLGKEFILTFALTLLFLSLLLMVVSSFQAVSAGFTLKIVLPWVFDSCAYYLYYTVPISLLTGATFVYGRFVGQREYTATAASGISPIHTFIPICAIALLFTGVALATQGTVFPDSSYKRRNIQRYLIKQLENLGDGYQRTLPIESGHVYCEEHHGNLLKGLQIEKYVEADRKNGELPDLENDRDDPNEHLQTVYFDAREGRVFVDQERQMLVLKMTDVSIAAPHPDAGVAFRYNQFEFKEGWERAQAKTFEIQFPINEKTPRLSERMTSVLQRELAELTERERAARASLAPAVSDTDRGRIGAEIAEIMRLQRKTIVEIWRRRSLALSCFTFAFLGFPISITLRQRHRLQSFFIGVVLVMVIFYPSIVIGIQLVDSQLLPAALAMNMGNAVIALIATLLTGRLLLR